MQVGLKVWRVEIIKSFRFPALVFGSHVTFAQTLRLAVPSPVEVRALPRPRGAGRGVAGGWGGAVLEASAPALTQPSQNAAGEHPEQPQVVLAWSHHSPRTAPCGAGGRGGTGWLSQGTVCRGCSAGGVAPMRRGARSRPTQPLKNRKLSLLGSSGTAGGAWKWLSRGLVSSEAPLPEPSLSPLADT